MTEQIMYATKEGAPDWMEEIITTHPERFDDAREGNYILDTHETLRNWSDFGALQPLTIS